jgi:predicted ArsR family transcriptional regulator
MSDMRRAILGILKREGARTIRELAEELGVTYEAVRQQLTQLDRDGWLTKRREPPDGDAEARPVGRPRSQYHLTPAGDHLFPKDYDSLSIALLDAIAERDGEDGLLELLGTLSDRRVSEWRGACDGLDLDGRLDLVRGIYFDDDPYISVERAGDGGRRLVERNCPFLNVAMERPVLCSLTVDVLSRMLGRRVVRDERFQAGDGRCSFRVTDEPADEDGPFELEHEDPRAKAGASS